MDHVALRFDQQHVTLIPVCESGSGPRGAEQRVPRSALPQALRARESRGPVRWVWDATATRYPPMLRAGVTLERVWDLSAARRILRATRRGAERNPIHRLPPDGWDRATAAPAAEDGLFAIESEGEDPVAEFARQRAALEAIDADGRLGLLIRAESGGTLVAAEMTFAGLPWSAERHDALLRELLGPRPRAGERPAELHALLERIRTLLDDPKLNPDSPVDLLRALRSAGLDVSGTSKWELRGVDHPAIGPLLDYKRRYRILVAHGWHWLDEWVHEGRFRPVYVPAGVVTGRWASDGGGALQIPQAVRGAVVADPGWALVVGDAAQLEPRVLAAMSGDAAMAAAGAGRDLYEGMVASGVVASRPQAKVGMLGALYGGTTGESARVLPSLQRAYPRAMDYVERAARAGERGESVSTWLGRGSPEGASRAWDETTSAEARDRARRDDRARGRFTRNFVVQGTAAEWALCWMGSLRARLRALGSADGSLLESPHLVLFLHDELVVHTPEQHADAVAEALRAAAEDAGRILFGDAPVDFPLSVSVVREYAAAK